MKKSVEAPVHKTIPEVFCPRMHEFKKGEYGKAAKESLPKKKAIIDNDIDSNACL